MKDLIRTLKEEFLAVDEYFEPLLTQSDLSEANNLLTSFLIFYNLKRPYCSLNYQTPIEWYNNHWVNKEKGVLPMYPTYTKKFDKINFLWYNFVV
jgi:hypothetical protein